MHAAPASGASSLGLVGKAGLAPELQTVACCMSRKTAAGPLVVACAMAEGRGRQPGKHRRGMKAQKAQQGFDKLLAGGGEWEIVKGRGRAVTPAPAYIWDALASHAPAAAELAACAANAASAAKYFEVRA